MAGRKISLTLNGRYLIMAENQKNTQYLIAGIVFISVMIVINFLNGKISDEIADHNASRFPAVMVQGHVTEAVNAALSDADLAMSQADPQESTPLVGKSTYKSSADTQEDTQVIYELPLKEIELPQ